MKGKRKVYNLIGYHTSFDMETDNKEIMNFIFLYNFVL